MIIFNLPDLGEGLPDAEIHEWFVKEGDHVKLDQPLVSMETAKAIVDVPCPQEGIVVKLYGRPGDVIKTGVALAGFETQQTPRSDKGTVVGNLEESTDVSDDHFTIGTPKTTRVRTTPAVRMLAKRLGVSLTTLTGSGEHGVITRQDVETASQQNTVLPEGFEPLRGVRRAMLTAMVQSHQEVVPVSLFDEADIQAWLPGTDISVRLIEAIAHACRIEPALNAWFDTAHNARRCVESLHLGLAMDSEEGLFVPVIANADTLDADALRQQINHYKQGVYQRTIPADELKGATFTLSNFGKFAGRFASPIIVPPTVGILAVGRLYEGAVVVEGHIKAHRLLPLSLSFDHRAVTGGEATRFLGAVMDALRKP